MTTSTTMCRSRCVCVCVIWWRMRRPSRTPLRVGCSSQSKWRLQAREHEFDERTINFVKCLWRRTFTKPDNFRHAGTLRRSRSELREGNARLADENGWMQPHCRCGSHVRRPCPCPHGSPVCSTVNCPAGMHALHSGAC